MNELLFSQHAFLLLLSLRRYSNQSSVWFIGYGRDGESFRQVFSLLPLGLFIFEQNRRRGTKISANHISQGQWGRTIVPSNRKHTPDTRLIRQFNSMWSEWVRGIRRRTIRPALPSHGHTTSLQFYDRISPRITTFEFQPMDPGLSLSSIIPHPKRFVIFTKNKDNPRWNSFPWYRSSLTPKECNCEVQVGPWTNRANGQRNDSPIDSWIRRV